MGGCTACNWPSSATGHPVEHDVEHQVYSKAAKRVECAVVGGKSCAATHTASGGGANGSGCVVRHGYASAEQRGIPPPLHSAAAGALHDRLWHSLSRCGSLLGLPLIEGARTPSVYSRPPINHKNSNYHKNPLKKVETPHGVDFSFFLPGLLAGIHPCPLSDIRSYSLQAHFCILLYHSVEIAVSERANALVRGSSAFDDLPVCQAVGSHQC